MPDRSVPSLSYKPKIGRSRQRGFDGEGVSGGGTGNYDLIILKDPTDIPRPTRPAPILKRNPLLRDLPGGDPPPIPPEPPEIVAKPPPLPSSPPPGRLTRDSGRLPPGMRYDVEGVRGGGTGNYDLIILKDPRRSLTDSSGRLSDVGSRRSSSYNPFNDPTWKGKEKE